MHNLLSTHPHIKALSKKERKKKGVPNIKALSKKKRKEKKD
jgi:hypothetical protein